MSADRCPAQRFREDMGLLPCDDKCETCPYNPNIKGHSAIVSKSPFVQLNLNRDYPTVMTQPSAGQAEDDKVRSALDSIQIDTQPDPRPLTRIVYQVAGILRGRGQPNV